MKYSRSGIMLEQFQSVAHPFNLPDFMDCFSYSLPYLLEHSSLLKNIFIIVVVVAILQKLVIQMRESGPMAKDEEEADEMLRMKCTKLYAASERARIKQDEIKRVVAVYTGLR